MPLVLMTPSGSGSIAAVCNLICIPFESWASRLAGWKIVMPSNALDAYGLMLSAIRDPNPVMVLLPKALLRVRGDAKIPGEPENEDELKERIDAPVGDRLVAWKTALAGCRRVFRANRRGVAGKCEATTLQHHHQLRPDAADVYAGRRRGAHGDRRAPATCSLTRRQHLPLRLEGDQSKRRQDAGRVLLVNEDTEVTNFGEHLLRRVVDEHFYDLLE